MMRRVLLAAAVAAVPLVHAPAAQADDYCPATAVLTGAVDLTVQVPPRCIPTSHATLCVSNTQGPSAQEVYVEVCLLYPLAGR